MEKEVPFTARRIKCGGQRDGGKGYKEGVDRKDRNEREETIGQFSSFFFFKIKIILIHPS